MKKELLTGAILTAGVFVTGSFETKVSADEVGTNFNVSNTPSTQSSLEDKITTVEKDLSLQKQSVQDSQKKVATAQENVSEAKDVLNQKQEAVNQAQEKVTSAEKDLTESTEKNISNMKSAIEDQKKSIENTQQDVNETKNKVSDSTDLVDKAQQDVDNAKQEVVDQQSIVKEAEQNVETANNAVNNTNKQAVIDEVSNARKKVNDDLENISSVENSMEKEQQSIEQLSDEKASLKSDIENMNTQIDEKNKDINVLASELKNAKNATEEKQKQVDLEQKNVNSKKETLNNTNAENVQLELDNSKKELEKSKMNLDSVKQDLADADYHVDLYETKVKDLTEKKQAAEAIFDKNKQMVDIIEKNSLILRNEKENSQNELENLQKQLSDLQTKSVPKIQFTSSQIASTQALVKALQEYGDLGGNNIPSNALQGYNWGNSSIEDIKNLKNIWGKTMTNPKQILSWKDDNAADQNTVINLDNLTTEQAVELSNFVATLLNQARDSLGISKFVGNVEVSEGSVNLALQIAKETLNGGWKYFNHDAFAVNNSASSFGLSTPANTKPGQTNQSYENASFSHIKSTMASLKENAYSMIQSMLFNDYTDDGNDSGNMGHAILNLGLKNIKNSSTVSPTTYLGVSNNRLATNNGNLSNTSYTHYVFISPSQYSLENTLQKEKGIFNVLNNPYQTLAENLNKLKYELDSESAKVKSLDEKGNNVKNDLENATNVLAQSKTIVDNVTKSLESNQMLYNNAVKNKNIAEQSLLSAQKNVEDNKNSVLQAQKYLDSYNVTVQETLKELSQAQKILADKQIELSRLRQIENEKSRKYDQSILSVEQLQADLEVKNKVYSQLDEKVNESKENLSKLTNMLKKYNDELFEDKESLNKATLALQSYEKSSEEKLSILNQMKEKLSLELETLKNKVAVYKAALFTYEEYKSDLSHKENELMSVNEKLKKQHNFLQFLRDKLYTLEHASELLENAKNELKRVSIEHVTSQEAYDSALTTLSYEQEQLTEHEARVREIEKELALKKNLLSMLTAPNLSLGDTKFSKQLSDTNNRLNETENLESNDYFIEANNLQNPKKIIENTHDTLSHALPKLGNRSSKESLLGGLLLLTSSLSLAFFNKKQDKKYLK